MRCRDGSGASSYSRARALSGFSRADAENADVCSDLLASSTFAGNPYTPSFGMHVRFALDDAGYWVLERA